LIHLKKSIHKDDNGKYFSVLTDENNLSYLITEEGRGTNVKFWITDANYMFETYNSFLFKSASRRSQKQANTLKNFGEVMAYQIARRADLNPVSYLLTCVIDENGDKLYGTACLTYRKNIDDIEISGLDLTKRYKRHLEQDGKQDTINSNTVYEYAKELKVLYGDSLNDDRIDSIKQYMLKEALFDYLVCQKDRHWTNIGFISTQKEGVAGLFSIPLYDNENCFLLNKPLSWINDFAEQSRKNGYNKGNPFTPLIDSLDRVPRLGIKTTTVTEVEDKLVANRQLVNGMSRTQVFVEELADEIHENEKFADFYRKISSLNVPAILNEDQTLFEDTEFDEKTIDDVKCIASGVWDARLGQLQKTYEQKYGVMEKTEDVQQ